MRLLLAMASLLVLITLAGSSARAAAPVVHGPNHKLKNGASTNWAGYAVESNLAAPANGAVSDVKGSWVVPGVTCAPGITTYSSAWIGIDGYSDGTVEQTGTEQDCRNGVPTYSAWYEMYPKFPFNLSLKVNPGDLITSEVKYIGNNRFTLTLDNASDSLPAYVTTQKSTGKRQSAEWIAEAPSSSGGVLPLANFGKISFAGSSATLGSHTGGINDSTWQNDRIDMTTSSGVLKASTSLVDPSGQAFDVTWASQ